MSTRTLRHCRQPWPIWTLSQLAGVAIVIVAVSSASACSSVERRDLHFSAIKVAVPFAMVAPFQSTGCGTHAAKSCACIATVSSEHAIVVMSEVRFFMGRNERLRGRIPADGSYSITANSGESRTAWQSSSSAVSGFGGLLGAAKSVRASQRCAMPGIPGMLVPGTVILGDH